MGPAERLPAGLVEGGAHLRGLIGGEEPRGVEFLACFDGGGEVLRDGAFGDAARAGHAGDVEPGAEAAERIAHGVGQEFTARFGRTNGGGRFVERVGEDLLRLDAEVGLHFGDELRAVSLELGFAHAGDAAEVVLRLRIEPGHEAEGGVADDDVGRDARRVGQFLAEAAELLEEQFVAGDVAGLFGTRLWRLHRTRQRDFPSFLQRGDAFVRDLQGGELSRALADQPEPHQLAADGTPFVARVFLADAVGAELVVAPLPDLLGFAAGEHGDDVVEAAAEAALLPDADDAAEKLLRGDGAVEALAWCEAVVASATVRFGEFLAEIVEQHDAAALGAFRVVDHRLELRAGDALLFRIGLLVDETLLFHHVAGTEEQEAIGGKPVASGAARLLVVTLDVLREIVVDDVADVGFVDAHAEGDRRADDARFVAEELVLVPAAFLLREPGVIRHGTDAVLGELAREGLGAGAARTVDDPAVLLPFADELQHLLVSGRLGRDAVAEVGAVEAGDVDRRFRELELRNDVLAHAARGRRGQRHERHAGNL